MFSCAHNGESYDCALCVEAEIESKRDQGKPPA